MHNVTEEDLVMQEEIFGPLLPIIDVESVDDAIKFVNKRYDNLKIKKMSRENIGENYWCVVLLFVFFISQAACGFLALCSFILLGKIYR